MVYVEIPCSGCGTKFNKEKKWVNFLRKVNPLKPIYCNRSCYVKHTTPKQILKRCVYCSTEFLSTENKRGKSCCSKSCAVKRSISFINRENRLNKIKEWHDKHPPLKLKKEFENLCVFCGNKFFTLIKKTKCCGTKCLTNVRSISGRKSVNSQRNKRVSKNEIAFAKLCKEKFVNVLTNENMFNGWDADVILPDQKIAILWNGKWHYEKITKKHSLEQVQNRDRIKLEEIKKCGYVPYVIKDLGKENEKFVEKQFDIFLKNVIIQ